MCKNVDNWKFKCEIWDGQEQRCRCDNHHIIIDIIKSIKIVYTGVGEIVWRKSVKGVVIKDRNLKTYYLLVGGRQSKRNTRGEPIVCSFKAKSSTFKEWGLSVVPKEMLQSSSRKIRTE